MSAPTAQTASALGSGAAPRVRRVLGVGVLVLTVAFVALYFNSRRDPAAFRDRVALPSCGDVVVEPAPVGLLAPAQEAACFNAAMGTTAGAELRVVETTLEGDPVVNYYRALPNGGVEVFIDSTADAFGSRSWGRRLCPEATAIEALGDCEYRSL